MHPYSGMAEDMGSNTDATYTGRSIVVFRQTADSEPAKAHEAMSATLRNRASHRSIASSLDFGTEAPTMTQVEDADAVTLPTLGVAIMKRSDAVASLAAADGSIEAVIPERWDYLRDDVQPHGPAEVEAALIDPKGMQRLIQVLRALRDLSNALVDPAIIGNGLRAGTAPSAFADTASATWGLLSTRVTSSRFSGRGVRVAIIDTGLDVSHPDFRGRNITRALFAPPGTGLEPTNSHGTHCAGTACGARQPLRGPRYGIASDSEIYALKVFNDDPRRPGARRGDVLMAMEHAHQQGCRILSLSLGSATNGAEDIDYTRAISRLRRAGSLTIAAAGNEGRWGYRVGAPASSPDAVAVAAVDQRLLRADFSNTGALDIAGPGVDVISSVIGGATAAYSGTSMAAPHVAGVAALWLEQDRALTPDQLESALRRSALRLPQSASEVGVGLLQAP